MSNTNKDIDKILQDIKKRKASSGVQTPTDSFAGISVQKRESDLIKSSKTVELKKPGEQRSDSGIYNPPIKPVESFAPVAKPVESFTPVAKPVGSFAPVAKPVESFTPVAKPVESFTPAANPVESFTPVAKPVESFTPVAKHVESFTPAAKPVEIELPITPNAAEVISSAFTNSPQEEKKPLSPAIPAPNARSKADVDRLINEIRNEKNQSAAADIISKNAMEVPISLSSKPTAVNVTSSRPVFMQKSDSGASLDSTALSSQASSSKDLENPDFLAKLATVLNGSTQEAPPMQSATQAPDTPKAEIPVLKSTYKDNPNFGNPIDSHINIHVDDVPRDIATAESIVDDKFVDFFTQSVIVPHDHDEDISIKRKGRGFFKKKYITDSLSLSIPEEDVKKAERANSVKGSKANIFKPKVADTKPQIEELQTPSLSAVEQAMGVTSPIITVPFEAQNEIQNDAGLLSSMLYSSLGGHPAADTSDTSFPSLDTTAFIDTEEAKNKVVSDITAMFMDKDPVKKQTKYSKPKNDVASDKAAIDPPIFEEFLLDNEFAAQYIKEDPAEILKELHGFKFTLTARFAMSIICAAVLFYLNFSAYMDFPLPTFMSPTAQPLIFYVVALVFYAIALIGFLPTIANGFIGIFKTPTSDSFLSLCAVMCLLQLNLSVINAQEIDPKKTTIFAGFLVLALGFNALGKLICANTISRNLSLYNVPDGINAGYTIKDPESVKKLSRTLEEKSPQILVSRKTGKITNFISGGFSAHRSEKSAKMVSIFTYVVTFICFFLGLFTSKDFTIAVFTATGASVLMLPLSHTLISSIPSSLMQKSLKQVGALVNGWQGIDQLSKTTHVSFDAKHLFPKGTVVLHGIKTFEKERLDHAILYASSIAIEKCDNLRPVFMNVIENNTDMLFPIESCEYKVGQGYIAWIEHNRVIMGNRNIMSQFDIELPPVSLETKFTSEGKKPIYLSVNGKLFGMFIVSYHSDPSVKENLDRLIANGVNVILQSTDFNIDSQLLELVYKLPTDTVQVLNQNETALLLNYTQYSEKTESCMAHLDSLYSLVAGFCGADSAKSAAATCSIVQTVSIVIGAVLAVMFSYSQTLPSIPLLSVMLLGVGWMGLCLMRAFAKKYY